MDQKELPESRGGWNPGSPDSETYPFRADDVKPGENPGINGVREAA